MCWLKQQFLWTMRNYEEEVHCDSLCNQQREAEPHLAYSDLLHAVAPIKSSLTWYCGLAYLPIPLSPPLPPSWTWLWRRRWLVSGWGFPAWRCWVPATTGTPAPSWTSWPLRDKIAPRRCPSTSCLAAAPLRKWVCLFSSIYFSNSTFLALPRKAFCFVLFNGAAKSFCVLIRFVGSGCTLKFRVCVWEVFNHLEADPFHIRSVKLVSWQSTRRLSCVGSQWQRGWISKVQRVSSLSGQRLKHQALWDTISRSLEE